MSKWDSRCAEILERMARAGYTDQEIAEHIGKRTGWTPERRTVMAYRQALGLDTCWKGRWRRRVYRLNFAA